LYVKDETRWSNRVIEHPTYDNRVIEHPAPAGSSRKKLGFVRDDREIAGSSFTSL
jgi:hypothetical protein